MYGPLRTASCNCHNQKKISIMSKTTLIERFYKLPSLYWGKRFKPFHQFLDDEGHQQSYYTRTLHELLCSSYTSLPLLCQECKMCIESDHIGWGRSHSNMRDGVSLSLPIFAVSVVASVTMFIISSFDKISISPHGRATNAVKVL